MQRRKRRLWLLLACLGALSLADRSGLFGYQRPDQQRYHNRRFAVRGVLAGHMLELAGPHDRDAATAVRMLGLAAWENQSSSLEQEAALFTETAIAGATVLLELDPRLTRDQKNHLMAYVYLPDGTMLNALLIETGHAAADPQWTHLRRRQFQQMQRQAQRAGRGLWAATEPPQSLAH